MNVSRREVYTGRVFLLALMAFTVLPFISIVTTALQPSGSLPSGLDWPTHPQWGNFVEAFKVANVTTLLKSSTLIVLTVVPISLVISTMAGFAIGLIRIPGARLLLVLFVFGLTLPFEGIITPLYFLARDLGILNTREQHATASVAARAPRRIARHVVQPELQEFRLALAEEVLRHREIDQRVLAVELEQAEAENADDLERARLRSGDSRTASGSRRA